MSFWSRLPQALFVAAAVAAVTAHLVIGPLPWPGWEWLPIAGAVSAAFGVNFMLGALIAMSQRGTSPLPWKPTAALASHGVYRFSRNPVYLGDVLLLAGFALWFGIGWLLIAALVSMPLATRLVIRHEEAYLAARFPDEWAAYSARVRRWL